MERVLLRMHILLLLAVIASALYLVQTQYAARRLFTELDQAIAKNRQLEEERERLQVRCWEALTDGVLDAAILARLENIFSGRSEAQRCQAWIDHQLLKVDAGLAEMSRLLGDRPFCYGNQFSLADIAVGCTLGWLDLRFPEIDWRSRHANLAELQSRLEQRQSFIDTVPA